MSDLDIYHQLIKLADRVEGVRCNLVKEPSVELQNIRNSLTALAKSLLPQEKQQ